MTTPATHRDAALNGGLRLAALALSAWAFWGITGNYFVSDDFLNFFTLVDWDFTRFVLRMHGAHLLMSRNLVMALSHAAFGMEPALYFWLTLVTHLVNVWLVFRIVERIGGNGLAAFVAAALWGMAPANEGTLGWYAVYGQVMAATAALWVLAELAACARGVPPRRGAAGWWLVAMLIGGTSFGVGLGFAAAMPAAAWLLLPAGRLRRQALLGLGLAPLLLGITYVTLQDWYAAHYGTAPEAAMLISGLGYVWPQLRYFVALLQFGIGQLALGPAGIRRLAIGSAATVAFGAVVAVTLLALWRGRGAALRGVLALALPGMAAYATIAAGRGMFAKPMQLAMMSAVPRYHYAAAALFAAALGVALAHATRGAFRSRRASGLAALLLGLGLAAAHQRWATPIQHFPASRTETARVLEVMRQAIDASPAGAPVLIRNQAFLPVGMLVSKDGRFPGWLGVYCLYFPDALDPDRRVFFVDPDPVTRRIADGRCSAGRVLEERSLAPASVAPPPSPPPPPDLLAALDDAVLPPPGAPRSTALSARLAALRDDGLTALSSLAFATLLCLAGLAWQRVGPGALRAAGRLAAGAAAAALLVWMVEHPSPDVVTMLGRRDHLLFAVLAGAAAIGLEAATRRWLFAAVGVALLGSTLGAAALALGLGVPLLALLALRATRDQPGWQVALLQAAILGGGYAACWSLRAPAMLSALVAQGLLAFTALRHVSYAVETRRGRPDSLGHYLAYQAFYPNCLGASERYDQFGERNLDRTPAALAYGGALARLALGAAQIWLARQMATDFATALGSQTTPLLWLNLLLGFVRSAIFLMGLWHTIDAIALLYGVALQPNFSRILTRRSPAEFWHAWRGTMTQWLVRYVYIPLGGNRRRQTRNIAAAFAVSMLWHWAGQPFLGAPAWPLQLAPIALWAALNAVAVATQAAARRHGWRLLPAATPAWLRTSLHWAGTLVLGSFTVTLLAFGPRTIGWFETMMLRLVGLR
ncbi:MAG: MBOAT family O-acyltransferase [Deltaproteobacteria bacterium]|nr:MBOAT family O-acyltransferase [Deltaproteobacteria bacterium]